jgi:hypothetical protein
MGSNVTISIGADMTNAVRSLLASVRTREIVQVTRGLRSSLKLTHGEGREFKKPQPSSENLTEGERVEPIPDPKLR